jgi:hypothetical protein
MLPIVLAATLFSVDLPAQAVGNEALAEMLFQQAKRLLDAGDVAAACVKFKASLDVDHANGTVSALAFCHEKEGKSASAWAEYNEVLSDGVRNHRPEQAKYAEEHIAALARQLRTVRIKSADDQLTVTIDGAVIPIVALSMPVPIDPGAHVFAIQKSGYDPISLTETFAPGPGESALVIPKLVRAKVVAPREKILYREKEAASTGRLIAASSVVGLGLGLVTVGAVFQFVVAKNQQDEATFLMREAYDPAGHDAKRTDAQTSSTIGITALVAGSAVTALGTYLLISAFSPSTNTSARIRPKGPCLVVSF